MANKLLKFTAAQIDSAIEKVNGLDNIISNINNTKYDNAILEGNILKFYSNNSLIKSLTLPETVDLSNYYNKSEIDNKDVSIQNKVGDLNNLGTTEKINLVGAINEVTSSLENVKQDLDIIISKKASDFSSIIEAINFCFSNNYILDLDKDYVLSVADITGMCSINGFNHTISLNTIKQLNCNSNFYLNDLIINITSSTTKINTLFQFINKENININNIKIINNDITKIGTLFNFETSKNIALGILYYENIGSLIVSKASKNIIIGDIVAKNFGTLINCSYNDKKKSIANLTNEDLFTDGVSINSFIGINTKEQGEESIGIDSPIIAIYGGKNISCNSINSTYARKRILYCSSGKNVFIDRIKAIGTGSIKFCGFSQKSANNVYISNNLIINNIQITGDTSIISKESRSVLESYFAKDIFLNNIFINDYAETYGHIFNLAYNVENLNILNFNINNYNGNAICLLTRKKIRDSSSETPWIPILNAHADFEPIFRNINFKNGTINNCTKLTEFFITIDDLTDDSIQLENFNTDNIKINHCIKFIQFIYNNKKIRDFNCINCFSDVILGKQLTNLNNINNQNINIIGVDKIDMPIEYINNKLSILSNYKKTGFCPIIANSTKNLFYEMEETYSSIKIKISYSLTTTDTNGARPISCNLGTNKNINIKIIDTTGTNSESVFIGTSFSNIVQDSNVSSGYPASGYGLNYTSNGIFEIRDTYKVDKNTKIEIVVDKI